MGKMKHITIDRLHSYVEGGLAGRALLDLEGHIATCERCYGAFLALKDIEENLPGAFNAAPGTDCPEDWEVALVATGELGTEKEKNTAIHIDGCEYCFERAARYYKVSMRDAPAMAAYDEWGERAVGMLTSGGAHKRPAPSLIRGLWQSLQSISSLLPPLPGYAMGTVAIILLVWVSLSGREARLVTIPSSERIMFRDPGPPSSFAFMSGKSEKIDGMKIMKKGRKLLLSWKPIRGAKEYRISIIKAESNEIIGSVSTVSVPNATMDAGSLKPGNIYLWSISGETGDGRAFEYIGKFLLAG